MKKQQSGSQSVIRTFLLILPLSMCFLSCTKETIGSSKLNEIQIRVENESNVDFESIFVNTSGGQYHYGDLDSGERSLYVHFDYAYSYAYVEILINGEKYKIQPIDYVGEEKLSEGLYTYKLDMSTSNNENVLVMSTVKD